MVGMSCVRLVGVSEPLRGVCSKVCSETWNAAFLVHWVLRSRKQRQRRRSSQELPCWSPALRGLLRLLGVEGL